MQKYSKKVPAYNRYPANISGFSFCQVKIYRNDSQKVEPESTVMHLFYVLMTRLGKIVENILNETSY